MSEKIEKYGLKWPRSAHPAQIEMKMIQRGGRFRLEGSDKEYGEGLVHHYEQLRKLIWPELDSHRWHELCLKEIRRPNAKVTVLMGPGSCVRGDTLIENPITKEKTSIKELCDKRIRPTVMTLGGAEIANIPYKKGRENLYEVVLESGKRFTSTSGHLVLTERGFVAVSTLQTGQSLFSYEPHLQKSNSDTCQSMSLQDARSFLKTTQDSQSDYQTFDRFCDEQLLVLKEIVQGISPSPAYAQTHSQCVFSRQDVQGSEQECSRLYQQFCRLSSLGALLRDFRMGMRAMPRAFSETISHAFDLFSRRQPFLSENSHCYSFPKASPGFSRNYSCDEYRVQADAVQQITPVGEDDFYDIQVPINHHYFAEGVIHHNSGKTHEAACNYLMEYYCFPNETCVLVSSTDLRGLELRVWGEIKSLHERARERFDFIPGNLIDSKHAIATDDIEEDGARDLRAGCIGIPTVQGGKTVGLNKWVGVKQKRVRMVADECQFMGSSFLSAFANLDKNEDFQAICLGNPIDFNDPLGRAAEPKDGWSKHLEPTKTECWDTRFMNGRCINLVGLDSPNYDFPENEPTRYKYLISREKIANTLSFFPENSLEYYSQCVGVMKVAGMERRVLTRDIIRQYGADQDVAFQGDVTKVYFVDASRGGDKCVGGHGEFGASVDGKIVLRLGEPKVIPIVVGSGTDPEYQIANFVKQDCQTLGVPPQNMGHDATGWGSLGTALAVVWSNQTIPVESGGTPTQRPVCSDLFILDDSTTPPLKRLKLCHEHYEKRVTEFWFSMRYAVESSQIKNLPDDAVEDLVERKWDYSKGNKIVVEAKSSRMLADGTRKVGMKERIGRSPDHGDWACGILEMARRRGFLIERLGRNDDKPKHNNTLQRLHQQTQELLSSRQLQDA